MTWWQLAAAGAIGGFAGAAWRDAIRWIRNSDWIRDRVLMADLKAIDRAHRRNEKKR